MTAPPTYGCPECGSPEPRYPASEMTCRHPFHVMARAVWRVYPYPPGDAGPKHREAVSAALRAVGDYAAALAAREPEPAPDARRALLDIIAEVGRLDEPGPAADYIRMLVEYGLGEAPHPGDSTEPKAAPELAEPVTVAGVPYGDYPSLVLAMQAEIDRERTMRLHLAGGRDEARSDFSRLRRAILDSGYSDAAARRRCLAIIKTAGTPPVDVPLEVQRAHRPGAWTVTELAAALDSFYGWFTVTGGGARVQGQLLGADAEEFARVLHAGLESARAHRGPCS